MATLTALPIRSTSGSEADPTAADLNTIITQVNTNTSAIAANDAAGIGGLTNTEARTATSDGLTTAIISDTTDFVVVTSAGANNIIVLPTPTPGRVVTLRNGATGYELRSSAPETVAINGGTGAGAESAIGANVLTVCRCDTATTWVCTDYSAAGVVSATEVAA